LSHRVLAGGYEAVVDAACAAWNALTAEPGRLRSLTSYPWLPRSVQTSYGRYDITLRSQAARQDLPGETIPAG
jgi:hypothetical protein